MNILTHHRDFTEIEWQKLQDAIPKFMMYLTINQMEKPKSLSVNKSAVVLMDDTRPWVIALKTAMKLTEYKIPSLDHYTVSTGSTRIRHTYMPKLLCTIELIAPGTITPDIRKYDKDSYKALSESYEELKHFIPGVKQPLPALNSLKPVYQICRYR